MTSGFTKLFSSIVTSSLWVEPDPLLRVWVAMLATSDANGFVSGSIPGFANLCRISVEDMEAVEAKLLGPDKYSRTPDLNGSRITKVPGGWHIVNYLKYREERDKDRRREYQRNWIREKRAKNKQPVDQMSILSMSTSRHSTKAEAEAEADKKGGTMSTTRSPSNGPPPPQFEPVKRGLYLREYQEMLGNAKREVKAIEAVEDNWELKLTKEVTDLADLLEREGQRDRATELRNRPDAWRKSKLKPSAFAAVSAWKQRIVEINAAMNGVVQ